MKIIHRWEIEIITKCEATYLHAFKIDIISEQNIAIRTFMKIWSFFYAFPIYQTIVRVHLHLKQTWMRSFSKKHKAFFTKRSRQLFFNKTNLRWSNIVRVLFLSTSVLTKPAFDFYI